MGWLENVFFEVYVFEVMLLVIDIEVDSGFVEFLVIFSFEGIL